MYVAKTKDADQQHGCSAYDLCLYIGIYLKQVFQGRALIVCFSYIAKYLLSLVTHAKQVKCTTRDAGRLHWLGSRIIYEYQLCLYS